jgi:hypothetical protein
MIYHVDGHGIVAARAVAPRTVGTKPLGLLGFVGCEPHFPGRVTQAAVVRVGVPGFWG